MLTNKTVPDKTNIEIENVLTAHLLTSKILIVEH